MIYGGHFDLDNKIVEREVLKEKINDADFWSLGNREEILKEYNDLNGLIESVSGVKEKVEDQGTVRVLLGNKKH